MKQNHFKLTSNTFRMFLYDFEQVLRFITRNYLQTRISKKKKPTDSRHYIHAELWENHFQSNWQN